MFYLMPHLTHMEGHGVLHIIFNTNPNPSKYLPNKVLLLFVVIFVLIWYTPRLSGLSVLDSEL